MNDCCQLPENRVEVARDDSDPAAIRVHEKCAVCGRNHYSMTVPPVSFGMAGSAL